MNSALNLESIGVGVDVRAAGIVSLAKVLEQIKHSQ